MSWKEVVKIDNIRALINKQERVIKALEGMLKEWEGRMPPKTAEALKLHAKEVLEYLNSQDELETTNREYDWESDVE